ncbi:Transmembrane protein [Parasponia andersonii]|uniref:Transmembrane protein n=1 Tax=Parasponia andersonii TaxID=3476 RepID=A0A2P5A3Q1_PARAD|nr:Transmembrane protein [Parasponia andersonii]
MDKLRNSVTLIVCALILFTGTTSVVGDEGGREIERKPIKASYIERLTSLLYVSSPTPPTTTTTSPEATSNWDKLRLLVKHAHAYLFPPNLEGGEESEAVRGSSGEKVKGAVARSLEKSKEAVEDSAKSAAKIAGETVKRTKDKFEHTFSKDTHEPHSNQQSESEL